LLESLAPVGLMLLNLTCFPPKFQISPEGVVIRDEKVFRFAKDQNIPLLMLTSGEPLLLL
jgi:hypothetical protein